ncbi:MAG: SDR family oxidoreductase [Acidobacteriia bacterium]|mgnify:CR=1 FL=1|jgi:NAD(P)-dependent dehydrogenase (short-subunit alcohol dehydrogenase family)|nr:SDR family oxidoreductase [Terriglobia bacterium]
MFANRLLADRTIFLTGGGTGLGRSMALHFAELGARIFLFARREPPLRETAEEIRRRGGQAAYATGDVRHPEVVEAAVEAAWNAFGRVDTLVNNAAGNFLARTETLSANAFAAVVGIVLHGSFHCTQALGRRWIAAGTPGVVLNILTSYVETGSAYVVPSACAKAGVLAMTRSLAIEWAPYRIRFHAIAPGPFPTEGAWSRLMPTREFEERARNFHPLKRFGRHEELTHLAVYLLSPMAEYLNGECIILDGGLWLRGAGQFNALTELPAAVWQQLEAARKK